MSKIINKIKSMFLGQQSQLFMLIILNCIGGGVIKVWNSIRCYGLYTSILAFIISGLGYYGIVMMFISILEKLNQKNEQDISFHGIIAFSFPQSIQYYIKVAVFYIYMIGLLIGNALFGIMIIESLDALGCIDYIGAIFTTSNDIAKILTYIILYFLMGLITGFDISKLQVVNIILAFIKILLVVVLPIACLFSTNATSNTIISTPITLTSLILCMFKTIFPFMGLECIMMEDGIKIDNLKSGIFYGIIACIGIYCLNALLIIGFIPHDVCNPYEAIFLSVFSGGSYIFHLILLCLITTSLYGWTYTAISYSLNSKDAMLSFIANNKYSNLIFTTIVQVITLIVVLIVNYYNAKNQFDIIIDLSVFLLLTTFIMAWLGFCFYNTIHKTWTFKQIAYAILSAISIGLGFVSIILSYA